MVQRRRTFTAALACGLIGFAVLAAPSANAVQFNPNPWRGFGFLNMAHQGGENEAPSSTLFAFKSAMNARGADMLELDVNMTLDNQLVVIHNDTVNSTTEETRDRASGFSEVNDLTLAEVQALDAGYSFRGDGIYDDDHLPASDYPYRGIRTGPAPPPPGYTPDDFAHPTLEQVLDAFPNTPINIEIKMIKTTTGAASGGAGCQTQGVLTYCDDAPGSRPVAEKLAEVLNRPEYAGRRDLLVVSFAQELVTRFNELAPTVAIAPGVPGVVSGVLGVQPDPDVSAFQIPPRFPGFPTLPETLLGPPGSAQARGYAVHIFTGGDQDENDAAYSRFTRIGVEGVMSSNPSRLHDYLCRAGVPRPDGRARCPAQTVAPTQDATTPQPEKPKKPKKCKKIKKKKKGKKGAAAAKKKPKKCKKKRKKRRKKGRR